uniref:Uncharacterized protein n=1 Tax=Avena sativa TaxID=4498 RepID=A0ACD6AD98_AVESA
MEQENNDKSSSQSQSQQLENEDRLSTLTDDILLHILGRVSLRMAARTCVLSTRWRHLPWLLPELSINVKDFLSVPCTEPTEANDTEELAMVSLTKATKSFLADQQRESTISSLHLKVYLINTSLCEVGQLVGDAVDNGLLKDLDLTVLDKTDPLDRSDEDMLQRAQEIDTFFRAYPNVLHCLTKLSLQNAGFDKLDMHHVLFDCCRQLKHLSLCYCDTGMYSVFKIDAPNSKLCVLEIDICRFERLELVCLPNLEKFICSTWESKHVPVTFGFVPSLGELELSCGAKYDQCPFKLSELLHGTTSIHTLTLDFQGEIVSTIYFSLNGIFLIHHVVTAMGVISPICVCMLQNEHRLLISFVSSFFSFRLFFLSCDQLWVQPEIEELRAAFNKLKKLSLCGIFVEFDILWTTAFLVAAPSIEKLCIQVSEHACDEGDFRGGIYRDRMTPQWDMRFDGSENRRLKELEIRGFKSLEQQFTFIRSMLVRCPNLQKIILRGDELCEECDALGSSLHASKFPKKDAEEMVVERIRDGMFLPEIIFDEDWLLRI